MLNKRKKLKVVLTFALMLLGVMLTSTHVFAYGTSSESTFTVDGERIYATSTYTENALTFDVDQLDVATSGNLNLLTHDIRDYSGYDDSAIYTLHILTYYGEEYTIYNGQIFSLLMSSYNAQSGYVEFQAFDTSGEEWQEEMADRDVSVYWTYEIPFVDASPVLDGQTAFVTTIDDPITYTEIDALISAYDDTDGNVTHRIERVDSARDFLAFTVARAIQEDMAITPSDLTVNQALSSYDASSLNINVGGQSFTNTVVDNVYGSIYQQIMYSSNVSELSPDAQDYYVLDYYVFDSVGNYATLEVQVLVKDVLAPVGNDGAVTVSYTETYNLDQYMSSNQSSFSDNYDSTSDLSYDIASNNYTANRTIPGTYEVVFRATDTSGNQGYATLSLTVIDNVAPVISGVKTITKATTEILTAADIKDMISANDAIDGNLTSSIAIETDDYTGHGVTVGSYDIEFSVSDNSGNTSYYIVTVNVSDSIPPIIYIADGYFISVDQTVTLTLEDFKTILLNTGQIDVDGSGDVVILASYNEYADHEDIPGIYALTLTGSAPNGDSYVWNLAVQVEETSDQDSVIAEDDPWYDDLWHEHQSEVISIGAGVFVFGLLIFVGFRLRNAFKKNKKRRNRRK